MTRAQTMLATAALVIGAISLSSSSYAQCIPDQFPNDWLAQQEIAGGHTIAKHIGKSDQQLINRVTGPHAPRADGSFPTGSAAQTTITQNLASQKNNINTWANNAYEGDRRADSFTATGNIGRVVTRQNPGNVMDTRTFCTVLEANGDGTCYLLTSFPTPSAQGYCN